ncbi:MAG: ACT domain-containing protein [Chloroflexi bacterium]|nr:ACT domain-containing protein [Chloroflexota bacterium]
MPWTLDLLPERFALIRRPAGATIPSWVWRGPLQAVVRTPIETSILTLEAAVPEDVPASRGWRALRVRGPLPLDLIGVLAELTALLAQAGVSVFAVSTYDTDYLLVQAHALPHAVAALHAAGHVVHILPPLSEPGP